MPYLKYKPFVRLALAAMLASLCSHASAQITTNILDTFNRNGALGGSSPDIGDVNSSPTNWVGGFTTTNAGGGEMINTGSGVTAQLPFAPQSGHVYTFSVTANIKEPADSNDRWVAVGFDSASGRGGFGGFGIFGVTGPWMLMKQNGRLESYYNGTGNAIASADHAGYSAGTNNLLQIVLDTTSPSNWKTQIKVNGVQYGSTTTLPSGFAISYLTFFNYGGVTTNTHLLVTSVQPAAPVISGQPAGLTNWANVNGLLEVAASGSQPMSYQWYKDSISNPLSGQTGESIAFSPLQGTDSGSYFVVITNSYGAVTSSVAPVHVETGTVMALTPSISVGALPGSDSDAASGINSTNTYVCALDFSTGSTPQVINGVTFAPVTVTGQTSASGVDSYNGGAWSLTSSTIWGVAFTTTANSFGAETDGSLATLLTDALNLQNPEQADSMTLTFGNVTPTGQYRIRLFYQQWSASTLPVIFTFNGQGSNEVVQLDENLGYSINSYGAYYVDYAFTAVTNSASVTQAAYSKATGTPYLYGAVLQQVSAPLVAPSVTTQPVGFTNWAGVSGSLNVVAGGSVPFHYQWYFGSQPLTDATNASISFSSLDVTNSGDYSVIITNVQGSVTSSVAKVLVYDKVWPYTPSLSLVRIPATDSDAASGIASTNTYLCALDFGDDTTELAINGVNFMQVNPKGAGTGTNTLPVFNGVDANYGGSWSLTASNTAVNAGGFDSLAVDYPGNVASQADGNLQAMFTDITYIAGNMPPGNFGRLTFGGLTPGAQYSLRYYYRQWGNTPRPIDFTFDGQGTNETVRVDIDAGGAKYVNYNFTAANTNVNLTLGVAITQQGPHFYGVTLQQTAPASGPTLTSVTPNPVKGSSHPVTLSLTGSGFTGASAVLLTNTTAATGASYTPTVNSDTSISVAFVPGTTASTWNATVVNGSPSTQVGFTVSVPSPVQITQTSVNSAGAGKVVLNGTGGTAGYSYVVVGATNLNPPVVWSPVVTNTFDGSGNFYYTNTVDTGKTTLFLRIQQ